MSIKWLEPSDKASGRTSYIDRLADAFEASPRTTAEKLDTFPKYAPLPAVARLLARAEFYRMVSDVPGAIVEAGVLGGAGFMSFAHLVFLHEPHNPYRRIVGFDTFEGFPSIAEADRTGTSSYLEPGQYRDDSYEELLRLAEIHESFRFLKSRKQLELVKGDLCATLPAFLADNPEFLVALLYLDCDLYAPTKTCLELLLPRMPKGALVVFDELTLREYPGETVALLETIGASKLALRRLPFIKASYAVVG